MSIYTPVSRAELEGWLTGLPVGSLQGFKGIEAGIENTNYFVDTATGQFVLTLFESMPQESLGFYLDLQARLSSAEFPCPQPVPDDLGRLFRPLAGKPAALLSRLSGHMPDKPDPEHCLQVGKALGQFHQLTQTLKDCPPHGRNAAWRHGTAQSLISHLGSKEQALLRKALERDEHLPWAHLKAGLIHADLFQDNTLWQDGQLCGILDFYFAGTDALLFDLAVAANDWGIDAHGTPQPECLAALVSGYEQERPLTPAELEAWPDMLAVAALRFWLSRLEVSLKPRNPRLLATAKDPEAFKKILLHRLG